MFRIALQTAVFLIAMATALLAGGSGSVSVMALTQEADAVVVADVVAASDAGSLVNMDISVTRVLKGTVTPGRILAVQWRASEPRKSTPAALSKRTGIFFLHAAGGAFTVLPIIVGDVRPSDLYIPVSSGDLPSTHAYQSSAAIGDKLTEELCAALETLGGADAALDSIYLNALESLKSATLTANYNRLLASGSVDIKIIGISGLLRSGDVSALRRLENEYSVWVRSKNFRHVVSSVCVYYRNGSPQSVPILNTLASAPRNSPALQRCAAHALRATHTGESLTALHQLLDSADQIVRYEAVFGLAAFANNLPVQVIENTANLGFLKPLGDAPLANSETRANAPSLPEFRANEQRYLTFWKQWWVQVQNRL